jgi:hypothetical protein
MCPVEINAHQLGGIYVNRVYTVLPYSVASGEKSLISHRQSLVFAYMVFGTATGGYYMDARDPFNSKYEIVAGQEVHLGPLTLMGHKKWTGNGTPADP